jgi:hypothetical protein
MIVKHDFLRIFGNKSIFDVFLFFALLFLFAYLPALVFSNKPVMVFIMGFYFTLYAYLKLNLHFSNNENYRTLSGGEWTHIVDDGYWSKVGYYENSSNDESATIANTEHAIENI